MAKTAINLYSVRDLEEPIDDVLDRVAAAGYDGVQFAGPYSPLHEDPDTLAESLGERGLEAVPPHVDVASLEADLDSVAAAYEPFDVDGVVVPWIDPEGFASADAVDETADRVSALADDLVDRDWRLHYHNHAHEYVDLGDEWAFERFVAATAVGIELDVGWALVGGDDPAERIRELGDRISQVHMKDMDADDERFVEIGEGDVDVQACADAARAADVEWLIYEHDDPEDPAASIDRGAAVLEDL